MSPPSPRAASSSVERCDPMNLTNGVDVSTNFMIFLRSLGASLLNSVVGTTPGDQEFTVMPFIPCPLSLRSSLERTSLQTFWPYRNAPSDSFWRIYLGRKLRLLPDRILAGQFFPFS